MTGFHVRPAQPGEAAALTALALRSKRHWGYDEAFMRLAASSLSVDAAAIARSRILVAADGDGDLLGVAGIEPLDEAGAYDLTHMFVDPIAMGRGVGRALFEAAIGVLTQHGGRRLEILSDPNAVPFYEKLGAVPIGDAPSDSIPGRRLPLLAYEPDCSKASPCPTR